MIQELIEELVEYIGSSGREEDVARAKAEYFRDAGGLYGEEETYNMRIGTFLEWYILDRRMGGKSLLEEYIDQSEDEEKKKAISCLSEGLRSIFEVTGVYNDRINAKDLNGGKKYIVSIPPGLKLFRTKNLIEARIFPNGKTYELSGAYNFHPEKVKKLIISMLKKASEKDDKVLVINRLAGMSLKWEKFRNYRVEEIYKDKEN